MVCGPTRLARYQVVQLQLQAMSYILCLIDLYLRNQLLGGLSGDWWYIYVENGSEEDDTERIPRGRCNTLLRKDESFRIAYIMAGLPLGEERVWLNLKSLHVMQQIASGHKH